MPLQHYLVGANAIFVSQPQPLMFAKAGCAWRDVCWHPGGPALGCGYTPSPLFSTLW